jgi:hypothetical protein
VPAAGFVFYFILGAYNRYLENRGAAAIGAAVNAAEEA